MRIALTYDAEKVFQQFGKATQFKLYIVDNLQVTKTDIKIVNDGTNLIDFIEKSDITVLICGGIEPEEKSALAAKGIVVYSGVDGDADEAVKGFLDGSLFRRNEEGCSGKGKLCDSCRGC